MSLMRQGISLLVFIVICFAAAGIGSLFTASTVGTWYQTLEKPGWKPPDAAFGPVWTVLYLMMAVSAWLVWRKEGLAGAAAPLGFFAAQLILNIFWSAIFFGLKMPGAAFGEIILLWLAIAATIAFFWKTLPLAGALLIPYLLWVTYASALNFAIWRMNG